MVNKNDEVFEKEKPPTRYSCITINPGFQAVCLKLDFLSMYCE